MKVFLLAAIITIALPTSLWVANPKPYGDARLAESASKQDSAKPTSASNGIATNKEATNNEYQLPQQNPSGYFARLFGAENLPNIGLFLVGTVGTWIAIKTLRTIKKQTQATEKSVEALIYSERPWLLMPWGDETLSIKDPYLVPAEAVPPKDMRLSHCMFFLKNYGRSPAKIVEERVELQIGESAVVIPNSSVYESTGTSNDFVFAQGAAILTEAPLKPESIITTEQHRDIFVNKSRFVWLCGYFKYVDTFNRENPVTYETRLCYLWETRLNSPKPFWTMAGAPKYNKAT